MKLLGSGDHDKSQLLLRVSTSRWMRAPVRRVWEFVNDLENDSKWWLEVQWTKRVSSVKQGVGEQYQERASVLGIWFIQNIEIIGWEPYRKTTQTVKNGFTHYICDYLFEEVDGGTRFTMLADVEFKGKLAVLAPLARWHLMRSTKINMDLLARLMEAPEEVPVAAAAAS